MIDNRSDRASTSAAVSRTSHRLFRPRLLVSDSCSPSLSVLFAPEGGYDPDSSDSVKSTAKVRSSAVIAPTSFKRLTIEHWRFQSARRLRGRIVGLWLPSIDGDGIQESDLEFIEQV